MTYVLLAIAALIFLWPRGKNTGPTDVLPLPFDEATKPMRSNGTYQQSIMALTMVRQRLIQTEHLTDDQKAAIDTLTLALVSGSDKE